MKPDSADAFLVKEIVNGSQSAWRQLIDRYSGRLLAFARARTASLNDAEDLVQETFVGFLQSLDHFDSSRSLETYLYTILRYKLYDLLRQRSRGDCWLLVDLCFSSGARPLKVYRASHEAPPGLVAETWAGIRPPPSLRHDGNENGRSSDSRRRELGRAAWADRRE